MPGQVTIAARALSHVVTAIAADELRVAPKDVAVRLHDERGLLGLSIATAVPLPPLGDEHGFGILGHLRDARDEIHRRTTQITGGTVGTVAIRMTRAPALTESRVS